MKKTLLLFSIMFLPIFLTAQDVVQSFDEPLDSTYFIFDHSFNASDDIGIIVDSVITTNVQEGAGSYEINYQVHKAESWGGYSRLSHWAPGDFVYDWSAYDSISFWYNNISPSTSTGYIHLRFNLYDVSDAADSAHTISQVEEWYSFQYILDTTAGWNEIKMPMVDGRANPNWDEWAGEAFNRTGWAGIKGNDELDKNRIKGFGLTFSISSSSPDTVGNGILLFDNIRLKGYGGRDLIIFNGKSWPSNFSEFTWGQSTLEIAEGEGETEGTNAMKWVQGDEWSNGWTGAGFNMPVVDMSREWLIDTLKFKLKTGGDVDSIRLRFEGGGGKVKYEFEPVDDGSWNSYAVPLKDFILHDSDAIDTTALNVFQITSIANATVGNTFYFDDMWTGSPVIDVVGPEAPAGVAGAPNPSNYFNLVIWQDVPGEDEEVYSVYGSENPITSIDEEGVFLIDKEIVEGTQSVVHNLRYPLANKEVTYYYAVVCYDASGNEGDVGVSGSVTNTAEAIPTISLNPPSNFVVDGDASEWFDSDITPFVFTSATNHASGTFDDDDDMKATSWLAVDDQYLYMAFDIIDDVYMYEPSGNFWEDDIAEVYIGLYNQTSIHSGFVRGEEPDYKFVFLADRMDVTGDLTYPTASDNYNYTNFGASDWVIEVKVDLDSLLSGDAADDARFHPLNGMQIALDLTFHDSDEQNVREGFLSFSGNSNFHEGVQNWTYTWIGDTNKVVTSLQDKQVMANHFELKQNYPNPFNPQTMLEYYVGSPSKVKVSVFNTLGQEVAVLVNAKHTTGTHFINFDGSSYSSGIYYYQIETDNFVKTKKMLLLK